jgi:hypothetical protein
VGKEDVQAFQVSAERCVVECTSSMRFFAHTCSCGDKDFYGFGTSVIRCLQGTGEGTRIKR